MDYKQLAERLFPDVTTTVDDLEARYPARDLAEGAMITRLGPSPTGFIHIGNLYGALIDERLRIRAAAAFCCALRTRTTSARWRARKR